MISMALNIAVLVFKNKHMVKQKFHIVFTLLVLSNVFVFAQKPATIKLDNPSFEDYPQAGHVPQGWFDCGFASETPPDIQPGNFQANKKPQHGITYVGMVVRDNNTWEAMAQRLKTPLTKGVTYTFSIYASRSELYVSQSKASSKEMNYTTPVVLRIWGGSGFCTKDEMLGETEPVMAGSWTKMSFKFTPKSNYTHFMIESFYKTPTVFPYNGNIMIDNASDIVPEDKDKDKPIVAVKPPPVKPKPATKPALKPKVEPTTPSMASNNDKPHDPKLFKPTEEPVNEVVAAKSEKFKEGQIMKIEKLQFTPNSTEIEKESYPQLDQVYNLLTTNPSLVVEIGGHTNLLIEENMADNLSTERARAVYKYLTGKGIESSRLVIKGYGKSKPLIKENTAAAHKVNQRVEIKILSTNG
jgi:outer membrane protein OmpA-like peptidoglycan-associated protein